jgi:hypothetical protein
MLADGCDMDVAPDREIEPNMDIHDQLPREWGGLQLVVDMGVCEI